jgi:hypothetical protein
MSKTLDTKLLMDVAGGSYFDGAKSLLDFLRMAQGYWNFPSGQLHEDANGYLIGIPPGETASIVLIDSAGPGGVSLFHRTGTFYVRYPARFSGSSYINAYTPANDPAILANQTRTTSGANVLYTFDTTFTQQAVTLEVHNGSSSPMNLAYDEISVHRAEHDHYIWDTPGSASGNWLPAGTRKKFNPEYVDLQRGAAFIRPLDPNATNSMLGYDDGFTPPRHNNPPNPIRYVASNLPLGQETDVSPYNHRRLWGGYSNNVLSDGTIVRDFGYNNMANPRAMGEWAAEHGSGLWYPMPASLVSVNSDYSAVAKVLDEIRIGLGSSLQFGLEVSNEPWNTRDPYQRGRVHLLNIGMALASAGTPLTCIQSGTLTSIPWTSATSDERICATLAHVTLRVRDMMLARFNTAQVKTGLNGHIVLPNEQGALWTRYVETVGPNAGKRVCQIVDYAMTAPYFAQVAGAHTAALPPMPPYSADPNFTGRDPLWAAVLKDGIDEQVGYVNSWNAMLKIVNTLYNGIMVQSCYEGGLALENQLYYYPGPDCVIDTGTNCMRSLETYNGSAYRLRDAYLDGEQWNNFNSVTHTNDAGGNPIPPGSGTGGAQIMRFKAGSDILAEMYDGAGTRLLIQGNTGTTYHSSNGTRWDRAPAHITAAMDRPIQGEVLSYYFTRMRGRVLHLPQFFNCGGRTLTANWGAIGTQDLGLNPALVVLNKLKYKGVAVNQP